MYQNKSTPVPIFNHRKRPRQAVIAGPDETSYVGGTSPQNAKNFQEQSRYHQNEFPNSNSFYDDLMPVKGFSKQNEGQNLPYGKQQKFNQNKPLNQSGSKGVIKQYPQGNQNQWSSQPFQQEAQYPQAARGSSQGGFSTNQRPTRPSNNYNTNRQTQSVVNTNKALNKSTRSMPPNATQQNSQYAPQYNSRPMPQQRYGIPCDSNPAVASPADMGTHQFTPKRNLQGRTVISRQDKSRQPEYRFTGQNNSTNISSNTGKMSSNFTASKSDVDKTLHMVTTTVSLIKSWNIFKDHFGIMCEVFGMIDSAVSRNQSGLSKEFVLRDDSGCMNCIFYEIDRPLTRLTRGHWHRLVGSLDTVKNVFKCVSIRPTSLTERSDAKRELENMDLYMKKLRQMLHVREL